MTTIAERNHDSGGVVSDHWTVVTTSTGLSITMASALGGSVFGLEIDESALPGASNQRLRYSFAALSGNDLRARIRVNFDNATQPGGAGNTTALIFEVEDSTRAVLAIWISESNAIANQWNVSFFVREDGQTLVSTQIGTTTAISGDTCLELRIIRATTNVSSDGVAEAYINGTSIGSDTTLDNFDIWASNPPNRLELQVIEDANWGGIAYVDELILDDDNTVSLCAIADDLTIAPMHKPADIDASGTFLYIAALNASGTPILLKLNTNLLSDASNIFDPGGGDNIGVQCSNTNANIIWIGGDFGGTDTIEKSEDAGASFVVKDPGTFDPVVSFAISPASDMHLLAATNLGSSAASGTLQATLDDGATWIEVNGSTFSVVRDVAQLDINVQEVVLGGETSEEIDYSVNYGGNLEDLSGGLPATDVNKVIIG